jgi:hypothetical protein
VNLPNSITLTRIFSIPVLIWLLTTRRIHGFHGEQELIASAVFILASITDGIDGYLARKYGQITTMGMLKMRVSVMELGRFTGPSINRLDERESVRYRPVIRNGL